MKNIFVSIILFLSCYCAYGQISTQEEPASFRTSVPALRSGALTQKIMPSLDIETIRREDIEDMQNGLPFRFGYKHEVDYTLENSGEWTDLPDGGRLWPLEISCQGAFSINLTYDRFWLPEGEN